MPTASGILIEPTSIAYTGTSATIGANGSVTFTACSSLSLNGVFTADYDNYLMVARWVGVNAPSAVMKYRLRASGTDASAANYTEQYIIASSTSVSAARGTSQTAIRVANISPGQDQGEIMYLYGPFLSQPTAARNVSVWPYDTTNDPTMMDVANTHSLSTSYDGVTFLCEGAGNNFSGRVTVYGMRQ